MYDMMLGRASVTVTLGVQTSVWRTAGRECELTFLSQLRNLAAGVGMTKIARLSVLETTIRNEYQVAFKQPLLTTDTDSII